jgi:PAS domain S-box-containing protein
MTARDGLPGGVPTGSGDAGDERAATERELRHAIERYRLIGLASNEALWEFDPVTYRVAWNDGLSRVFGHPPDEIGTGIGWWARCVHPDDRPRVAASFDAFMAGSADFWSEEYRFRRGDGSYASVLDRGYALRENGELVRPTRRSRCVP